MHASRHMHPHTVIRSSRWKASIAPACSLAAVPPKMLRYVKRCSISLLQTLATVPGYCVNTTALLEASFSRIWHNWSSSTCTHEHRGAPSMPRVAHPVVKAE